jgi:hypothetical protein
MVRPREGNFDQIPLYLDRKEFDEFEKNLPKRMSVSKAIREYIREENDRIEREKKVMGHDVNHSPITTMLTVRSNKQNKLDMYFGRGFMDFENWEERQKIFNDLAPKQRTDIMIALNRTTKAWSSLIRTEEARKRNE